MNHPVIYADLKYTPEPLPRKLLGPARSRWQPWSVLILREGNNEPLFRGTESWTNKMDAVAAINLALGADSIVYLRQPEAGNTLVRHPEQWPAE